MQTENVKGSSALSRDTVAFWLPDRSAQIMLSTTPQPAGPMFLVADLDMWARDHAESPTQ